MGDGRVVGHQSHLTLNTNTKHTYSCGMVDSLPLISHLSPSGLQVVMPTCSMMCKWWLFSLHDAVCDDDDDGDINLGNPLHEWELSFSPLFD
jgi:hypothetical protein